MDIDDCLFCGYFKLTTFIKIQSSTIHNNSPSLNCFLCPPTLNALVLLYVQLSKDLKLEQVLLQTGPPRAPPRGVLIPSTASTLLPGAQAAKQVIRASVCLCATKLGRETLTSFNLKTEYKGNSKEVPPPCICPLTK